jgi:aconitate hydratase
MAALITFADGSTKKVPLDGRIMTLDELEYFRHGGIMQYVIRQLLAS